MIGHIGLLALICTAMVSTLGAVCGLIGTVRVFQSDLMVGIARVTRLSSFLALFFSMMSMVILAYGFAIDDFALSYVSQNSNSQLPLPFKIAATWGGHEGSMLFWVVTLSLWCVGLSKARAERRYRFHATWIMLCFIAIFAWFTLLASNPFEFNPTLPAQGRDLNPMLQDIGLIIHPPLLYIGYVGFASVLALAVGALLDNESTSTWLNDAKTYTLNAWIFLSVGIAVGSWWAYYELGWGGWWFWDPVENASLLPWLTATALMHTLLASRVRNQLLIWSYSLAFVTFCLSILGTFIVRSGVLTSVHAFAVDPSKGFTLLGILSLVFILSFLILIKRIDSIQSRTLQGVLNKNFLLLACANLFTLATTIVVFGTFYPMVYELVGLGNISVGAPYFNLLIAPLAIIALFVVGFSALLKWDSASPDKLRSTLVGLAVATLGVAGGMVSYYVYHNEAVGAEWSMWAFFSCWGALWVVATHGIAFYRNRSSIHFKRTHVKRTLVKRVHVKRMLYVSVAHIGFAVVAFGAAMNSEYSYEITRKLGPTSQVEFGDYQLHYVDTQLYVAPTFSAERAVIEIRPLPNKESQSEQIWFAYPEKRHYPIRVMNMTEPSMTAFWDGDIYISLGEKIDSAHYAVRIQFKAFIRWIWLGALLMVLGVTGVLFSQREKSNVRASCENNPSIIAGGYIEN
ncbi:heme lyase CcmF/NrfE family subunit [Vibrio methylphosphonaticus]|uniref:heme lyase CcmF/NrfE family subunit n=1 Tax=Vibrio methylphosphonaticus TaxID=2946866 RepID=UPI00202A7FCC|nr:heme lyase NrfEFG subunit NrfE [Vibrio methylphosphonaticus]MCL9774965.1 heme lyase NrfEFG subunit NrfE [Vibrio methylphosphonaticus]